MADVTYASNGKGNLGVTLGAIGTGLGALSSAGGLGALLGNRTNDPEDRPVTRYEMSLIRDAMAKDNEIAMLKSQMYSDNKAAALQAEISGQSVWNATQEGILRQQKAQIDQLYSLTKLVVPNDSVTPGWGAVSIKPAG